MHMKALKLIAMHNSSPGNAMCMASAATPYSFIELVMKSASYTGCA
jgi:hypothetical protein